MMGRETKRKAVAVALALASVVAAATAAYIAEHGAAGVVWWCPTGDCLTGR